MGTEVATSRFNKQDFKAYEKRLQEETALLGTWFEQGRFVEEHPMGGFELEAWLVDDDYRPAPRNERFLDLSGDILVVPELAKFNVEMNGSPLPLRDRALPAMETELAQTWRRCRQIAAALDCRMLMIGTLPTVRDQDLTLENMSGMERFRALNEQVLRLRKGRPIGLDIQGRQHLRTAHYDVMLEAAATSFQIHLQVGARLASRYLNASMILSAPMVAASANSPFLFGKDLWDETRIPLFEQAIAVGGYDSPECGAERRVSFGTGFVRGSPYTCYQNNRACFPVLQPAVMDEPPETLPHLRLHNGTIWRWNRPLIGFGRDGRPHLRIEHRVVPAGPTVRDSFANAALYYGLVHALATRTPPPEDEIGFDEVRRNFYAAAKNGLRAKVTWLGGRRCAVQDLLLEELLPLARQGLDALGLDGEANAHYLEIIAARVRSGRNGAAWQRAYVEKHQCGMKALTAAYLERQESGKPVHEWPL